ncbi:MAG: site-specific integrase [Thermoplasmata archaeon]|nr:site-specific integrase [Thermoplasmata archaeon]
MAGPRGARRHRAGAKRLGGEKGISQWARAVARFDRANFERDLIGDTWRHRIVYELRRTPQLLVRAGVDETLVGPGGVRAAHVRALKTGLPYAPATLSLHLVALRRFLRWAGNPLARDRAVWAVPSGSPSRRRWLAQEDLARLYRAARGRERALVALEGFNGLRRVEVLRLRYQDVDAGVGRLRLLGKGRHGGKWRTVPLSAETARALRALPNTGPQDRPLIPRSRSGADLMLRRAALRAGFPQRGLTVSHHDLRRTFGRLAHKAGMDLVQLKNLYGHTSLDQTVHYIGLDEDEMRAGLDRLTSMIAPSLATIAVRGTRRGLPLPRDTPPRPERATASP